MIIMLRVLSSRYLLSSHRPVTSSYYISSCYTTVPTDQPKPYSDIPKKKGFMKFFDYFVPKPHDVAFKRIQELGPLYREKFPSSMPEMLMISDPKDVETLMRSEGKWPLRDSVPQWREARQSLNLPIGFGFSREYEEWNSQRKPVVRFMLVPRKVQEYHEDFNNITHDMIRNIRQLRDPNTNVLNDVPNLLFNWSFESTAYLILGKRLGGLNIGNVPESCQAFINNMHDFFLSTHQVLNSPVPYKIFPTKAWKRLQSSTKTQYEIAMKYIEEKFKEVKEREQEMSEELGDEEAPERVDFLTYMIYKGDMSLREIAINTVDLLGGAVDTTSNTLSWALYCLAVNPTVQTKLRNEIMSVVGKEEIVTPEHIHNLPYLRQCIRESQRMYPIAIANARTTTKDIIISGYHVPKGTEVYIQTYAMSWLPHLFPEPEVFRPERWSRDDSSSTAALSQFASLPFGFGPRMCPGRRVAELELHIALAHIIKTFTVDYTDTEPMDTKLKLLLVPSRELNLTFKDLSV